MKQWGWGGSQGMLRVLSLGWLVLAQGAMANDTHDDPRTQLPARKAGLWEVTIQPPAGMGGGQLPQTVQQCTDAQAERVMLLAVVPAQENCRRIDVDLPTGKPAGGYDIDLACSVHEQTIETRVELRGDLGSVYSGTYTVRQTGIVPPPPGTVNFQGRWLGSCKADQRPGDMVLPNGITVNVVDDVGRAEKHAH